jgi:hypothetical protein
MHQIASPVVARRAVPIAARADVGERVGALADHELTAREGRVTRGGEASPDAVQLQVLDAQRVAGRLQLRGPPRLGAVEGESGLDGEEQVLLAVVQGQQLAEGLLEVDLVYLIVTCDVVKSAKAE